MERKRKALEDGAQGKTSKYVRRGDVEKQRQESYRNEQLKRELERQEKQRKASAGPSASDASGVSGAAVVAAAGAGAGSSPASPPKRASRSATPDALGAAKDQDAADGSSDELDPILAGLIHLTDDDVVKRLRSRDQPIRLFGESNVQRLKRLRIVESTEERTEGQRNDFRDMLQATDKGLAEKLLRGKDTTDDGDGQFESTASKKKKIQATELDTIDTSIVSLELLESDRDLTYNLIAIYIKRVLVEWDKAFQERPDEEKRTTQGKLQAATIAQAGEYLKPFFKSIKRRDLPDDVLARVTEICQYMQMREYTRANDSYLRLSIGNAPWPIGVTMVGIHERSGRERIFASQIAHALNDETQRKWIQSIKRLMTFAQIRWPPSDLAKLVG
ncbi:Prp18 domain-containing protein [Entophlyctis helioformis]|nr:Prp18 domain-containing protein [Entophlyctis helioformis]